MPVSVVIRGGTVFDGTGSQGVVADVAIDGDRVVGIGAVPDGVDAEVIEASGLAVVPGFINVLSHAWASLQIDGSGASDVMQGVTTEVFGEAFSLGPSSPLFLEMLSQYADLQSEATLDFARLSEGLATLARGGVAPNVASFVGGHNLRTMGGGLDDRRLTAAEIDRLRGVLGEEMADGALGLGTALIYAPGSFADTDELVALCETVAAHDGLYISHLRSEGDQFLECLDELLLIGDRAGVRTEVFHLKAAGQANWPKMKLAIERIEQAQAAGRAVAANMYPYTAGGTSLAASIPPPYDVGGPQALLERLADRSTRAQIVADLGRSSDEWENLLLAAGGGEGLLFFSDLADGTPTRGRRLSEVAVDLGLDVPEALLEVVTRDPSIGVAYFIIDEDNMRLGLAKRWVSLGSDAETYRPEDNPDGATHPRAYGTFARFLGHYCRDEGIATLPEAIRRMSGLPAERFRLKDRGVLRPGAFADVVVLDAAGVIDHATYEKSHVYATGVRDVLVNGVAVLRDGVLTEARPGRALRRGV